MRLFVQPKSQQHETGPKMVKNGSIGSLVQLLRPLSFNQNKLRAVGEETHGISIALLKYLQNQPKTLKEKNPTKTPILS